MDWGGNSAKSATNSSTAPAGHISGQVTVRGLPGVRRLSLRRVPTSVGQFLRDHGMRRRHPPIPNAARFCATRFAA